MTSSIILSRDLLISLPLVYGTTQKEQYLLQPSIIETKAEGPPDVGSGKFSNFSVLGKETSITAESLLEEVS